MLSNLVSLDLSGNSLQGKLPALPQLTSLSELLLDNNGFTGFEEPWVLGTKSLQQLSISNNQLEGTIPSSIVDSINLMSLNLSGNNLGGIIPSGSFAQMNSLYSVDLSQNQLTGEIPPDLLLVSFYAQSCVSLQSVTQFSQWQYSS